MLMSQPKKLATPAMAGVKLDVPFAKKASCQGERAQPKSNLRAHRQATEAARRKVLSIRLLQCIAKKFHQRLGVIKRRHQILTDIGLKKLFFTQSGNTRETLSSKVFNGGMLWIDASWSCLERIAIQLESRDEFLIVANSIPSALVIHDRLTNRGKRFG